jgi:hypothetical protein
MGSILYDDEGEASRIFGIPTNVTLGAPQWDRVGKAVNISEDGLSLDVAVSPKQGQQTAVADVFSALWMMTGTRLNALSVKMVVALAALSISLKIGASS